MKRPSQVKALSYGNSAIRVSWSASGSAEKFQVYRYNSKSGQWKLARTVTSRSASFTGLSRNTTYKFKVRAISGTQKTSFSSVVSAKTGVTTRISLSDSKKTLQTGNSYTLKATVTAKAPSQKVSWSSSDVSVATVSSSGKVKGLKAGTAVITARAHNGATASCKITVKANSNNQLQQPSQPESSTSDYEERFNQEMLHLVNQLRTANGRKALSYSTVIQKAADTRAREAIRRPDLGHNRYDQNGNLKSFSSVYTDLNLDIRYTSTGENLAWRGYQSSPEEAAASMFAQWKNSTGHRENMLNSGYTSMATAIAYDQTGSAGYRYSAAAVQLFLKQ